MRLERTVSWSQTRRDTNFAIPGYSIFCHDTTARGKIKDFSVCGHSCGQSRFCAVFGNRGKSRKRRCCKALRRFALPCSGYRHGTPKCRALPVELHPDIHFSVMIPRRGVKIKFFLSVVIYVVKPAFVPPSATGESPANAGVARLCGVSSCPAPDTATALPNVTRYQLRHTRIGEGYAARSRTAYPYYIRFSPVLQGGNQPFRAAFRAATRSVDSQRTPRSSRPMWP